MKTDQTRFPNRVAQVSELAAIVLQWGFSSDVIFNIKQSVYEITGGSDPTKDELLSLTIDAFRIDGSTLFVDWNEGPILDQTCGWAFDSIRRNPLPMGISRDEPSPFIWNDEDASAGLEAFAVWLQSFRPDLSLLNMKTRSDFYFALVCQSGTVDQAVSQMKMSGLDGAVMVEAERSGITALEAISITHDLAVDKLGYKASSERLGRFYRPVNDRFSTVIDVLPRWDVGLQQHVMYLQMNLANHEMNELGRSIMHDERMVRTFPTINLFPSSELEIGPLSIDTFTAWLHDERQMVTDESADTRFKESMKNSLGRYAPVLLSRLMNHDWPKKCDTGYLRRWEKRGAPRNLAVAKSVREYLAEHSIPYEDLR